MLRKFNTFMHDEGLVQHNVVSLKKALNCLWSVKCYGVMIEDAVLWTYGSTL